MTRTVSYLVPVILAVGMSGAQSPTLQQIAIPDVIAADARIELVRGGFQGLEGPVPIPGGGLYFSDITANRTYRLDENGSISIWRENTKGTNGLFLSKDGRLLGAEGTGARIVAAMPGGRVTPLATEFNGKAFRSPNDLIGDKKGGFISPIQRPGSGPVRPRNPATSITFVPTGRFYYSTIRSGCPMAPR